MRYALLARIPKGYTQLCIMVTVNDCSEHKHFLITESWGILNFCYTPKMNPLLTTYYFSSVISLLIILLLKRIKVVDILLVFFFLKSYQLVVQQGISVYSTSGNLPCFVYWSAIIYFNLERQKPVLHCYFYSFQLKVGYKRCCSSHDPEFVYSFIHSFIHSFF
jgi:hypothetical protein